MDKLRVRPADFYFCGMNVYIDAARVYRQEQKDDPMPVGLHQAAIRLFDRMLDIPVADEAPVDERVLPLRCRS